MNARTPAVAGNQRHGSRTTAVLIAVNRRVYWIARHWLLLLNLLAAPFALLPIVGPVARAMGFERPANAIYSMYAPICHQLDDRSFHVMGQKFACCERCFAIYSGLLLMGAGFGIIRRHLPAASLPLMSLLSLPILIDVFAQPALQRDGHWLLRTTTGLVFALALSWFVLPRLQQGFSDIRTIIELRFSRLVAEGRSRPLRGADLLGTVSGNQ